MFPIKRIEQLHQELHHYYSQVIAFEDKDPQYQSIITKLSMAISELEDTIEEIRKYNNNKNSQLVNINK